MDHAFDIAVGGFAVAAGYFIFLWVKKGWTWGAGKLQAWWNAGKADLTSLKSDVESKIASIEARVKTLENRPALADLQKLVMPPPPAPNPNVVNGVQQSPS